MARVRTLVGAWAVACVVAGCGDGSGGVQLTAAAPSALAAAPAGATAGLVTRHGDVALLCDDAVAPGDHPDLIPDCDAAIVAADGTVRPLRRGGLLAAARLDAERLVLGTRDLRLVVRDARGGEIEIARAAVDPRVEGGRVAYTELPAGTTEYQPGTPGQLVVMDLVRGTRRVVTDDAGASSPFPVPGSDDVLYVSARTGLASLWLAPPAGAPRQVTNLGKTRVDGAFVPVPGRELVFRPGTRVAVFAAIYGGASELWEVDVDTGRARDLGAGRWPEEVVR